MKEFDLIARYFDWPAPSGVLGVGDDAALLELAPGKQLVVSADMLIEGRHFFSDADPGCLARKALAVNLSDLAAMGATPRWFTLSLALPEVDTRWLEAFSRGLRGMADEYGVLLVGGDTTCGPLTISIQIMGEVEQGTALLRSGGWPGDDLWVSGPLGAAAAAVMHRQGRAVLSPSVQAHCDVRLDLPEPRLKLGQCLRGIASAALDISDGLVADAGHICERSGCGAEIWLDAVPYPHEIAELPPELLQEAILAGGDDYELCFAAPADKRSEIEVLALELSMPLTRIGRLVADPHVRVLDAAGSELALRHRGFDHFAG